jgi:hypothetical protein
MFLMREIHFGIDKEHYSYEHDRIITCQKTAKAMRRLWKLNLMLLSLFRPNDPNNPSK